MVETVEETFALRQLSEPLQNSLQSFRDLLRESAGSNALSLTVIGHVANGTFDPLRHSIRSVLVLERIDLGELKRIAEHGANLGRWGIAAPLIMTPSYIEASLDTFPLELIDIKQHHIVVFGDDYFADLTFDDRNVRIQCERELKVALITLRQGLLTAAGRDVVLKNVGQEIGEGLIRTLQGMLWLKDHQTAMPPAQTLAKTEEMIARKLPGIRQALDPDAAHDWLAFESLYRDVEALKEIVDGN